MMNAKKLDKGMALVLILLLTLVTFTIFFAFQYFAQSEYKHLEKILDNTRLDYLVRAGLNLAEDKLQKERWYGDKKAMGQHEEKNFPFPGAKVTIYADDYRKKDPVKIDSIPGYAYYVLDHIKVYVEASYKGTKRYGYAKFIMVPEPLLFGKSTHGVNITFANDGKWDFTFRKLINVKLIQESEIRKITGFSSLSNVASRLAMAGYLKTQLHEFAKNYGQNVRLSRNIAANLKQTDSTYDLGGFRSVIQSFDTYPTGGETLNQIQNRFILENMKNFVMDVNWDYSNSERSKRFSDVHIEIGPWPPKKIDKNSDDAVNAVFGGGHPKVFQEGRDYWAKITGGKGTSAFTEYLKKRGIGDAPDKPPKELQDELSKSLVQYSYSFRWYASGLVKEEGGVLVPIPNVKEGGAPVFLYYYNNQGNTPPFGPSGKVNISGNTIKETYANYYLVKGSMKLPLAMAFGMFLKYVDEEYVYVPDEPKTLDNCREVLPPKPPGDGNVTEWGGVDG